MTTWQAARAASKRGRKVGDFKMHGPVMTAARDRARGHDRKCVCHGYNVCPDERLAPDGTFLSHGGPLVTPSFKRELAISAETMATWTAPQSNPPAGGTLTREKIMTALQAPKPIPFSPPPDVTVTVDGEKRSVPMHEVMAAYRDRYFGAARGDGT